MSVLPPSYTELARACLNCKHLSRSTKIGYICQKIQSDAAGDDDRAIPDVYGHCAEFEWCEEAVAQFKADRSSP